MTVAEPAAQQRTGVNVAEYSVSELASAIKRTLEDGFGYVRLRGEISGFRGAHASGHCYFALKDDKAKIEAVIWRATFQRLRVKPEEGMEVVAQGRVTTYPGSSKYQIVIDALEPAGVGALMAVLEERKRRLAAEGVFDDSRKQPLPFLPRVVGIVTSATGAVIRDMLHGFDERFPVSVLVWPVRVQGETCAGEVAAAIRGFNALSADGPLPRPDVLIVARGGGSLEDLWGFNDEAVVRAAAESGIPLISAVGHETDWTLIDLAADARAPTPTKAAEWAVPKFSELAEGNVALALRLAGAMRRVLEAARAHLKAASRGLPRRVDLLALPRQRFDATERRLGRALLANTRAHGMRHARITPRLDVRLLEARLHRSRDRLQALSRHGRDALSRLAGARRSRFERSAGRLYIEAVRGRLARAAERLAACSMRASQAHRSGVAHQRARLSGLSKLLVSLGYQGVLERGFALVRDAGGRTIRSVGGVTPGAELQVELADGCIDASARAVRPSRSAPQAPPLRIADPAQVRPPRPPRGGSQGGQGSLF
ncbi:MAG: exodeoxyribonuclease VII large subunit [Hyphomicrobiaceae bacterium]|nr:exodeoxyribonuclease VII large subunit [Hyphomicrobiaceae bacterium]